MDTWSEACFAARSVSPRLLLQNVYGSGGVLIFAFIACACLQAAAFVKWKRSQSQNQREWKFYGWFTASAFIGCVNGALAYGMRAQKLALAYKSHALNELAAPTLVQKQEAQALNAESRYLTTAEYIFYPFEMASVVIALLLVLHRVKDFVFGTDYADERRTEAQRRKKRIVMRSFVTVIALLVLLSICSCFAASAYFHQGASNNAKASDAFSQSDAGNGEAFAKSAKALQFQGDIVVALSRWADVGMLSLILAAYVTLIIMCSKVFSAALRTLFSADKKMSELMQTAPAAAASYAHSKKLIMDATIEGKALQRKIIFTFVFAFFSLLLRTIFSFIYAMASSGQDSINSCAISHCDKCKSVYSHVHGWLLYTAEFQFITILLSSPITMIVSLWGMSGVGAIEALTDAQRQMTQLADRKASKDASDEKRISGEARIN